MIEGLISALALLISSGAAYYSRQKALSEMRRREICRRLCSLRNAIEDIRVAGNAIGEFRRLNENDNHKLSELIHLLEVQQANLARADQDFEFLANIFEAKLPTLNPLVIHLRGKKDRIEVIYSTARGVKIERSVAPWESSLILREPSRLRGAVSRTGVTEVSQRGRQRVDEDDPDFDRIIEVLPDLQRFIQENCRMEEVD